jgi:CheY-like chemotaxis protein
VTHTKYAAVLINTEMQTMDGFACAECIREYERLRFERVPIIGVRTGSGAVGRKLCVERGMDDVLVNIGLSPFCNSVFDQINRRI